MGAIDLLCDLMADGVEFETDGERIRWRNGGAKLTFEHLAVLKESKAVVLQFLQNTPNTEAFEERAAIAEYDGGLSRPDAEDLAAQHQGFDNVVAFRAAQQKVALKERGD